MAIYTNSSLVDYVQLSPNHSGERNHVIDTISIHCVVGQLSVETLGKVFATPSKEASCNYGIGSDGRIGMYVEEKNRSWCTSSASNDHRAITIEVASDNTEPYEVKDVVIKSLIKLCADICKRNDIKKLLWKGDKSLIGQVDKQNMTVHRWFSEKSCPGEYLYNKHGYIANEVNKILESKKYGWQKDDKGWWYKNQDNSYPKSRWMEIDNYWYYFNTNGYAICSSWEKIDNKWYYFNDNCQMVTGWQYIDSKWYYFNSDGAMLTGWQKINEKWYYLGNDGVMVTKLQTINQKIYYFADDGHMCYTDENGALV